jgi:hypothetical protein
MGDQYRVLRKMAPLKSIREKRREATVKSMEYTELELRRDIMTIDGQTMGTNHVRLTPVTII